MTHPTFTTTLVICLLIWAGACIGANMIAAPAKFQVIDLTRPVALQVGRMQFQWVGFFEYLLATATAVTLLFASPRVRIVVGIAIVLFIVQRVAILPQLSDRTDQVIIGNKTGGSHLHIYFIVGELFKIVLLLTGAVLTLSAIAIRTESV